MTIPPDQSQPPQYPGGQQPPQQPGGQPPQYPGGQPPQYGAPQYGGQPPYGGQAPQYQGGQQPYNPMAMADSEERMWSMFSHLGGIFFGFIPSLVIYLIFKERSAFVKDQAKEALNFQITVIIGMIASVIVAFIGIAIAAASSNAFLIIAGIGYVAMVVIGIASLVFCIIGAVKSYQRVAYRYPVNIRLVK